MKLLWHANFGLDEEHAKLPTIHPSNFYMNSANKKCYIFSKYVISLRPWTSNESRLFNGKAIEDTPVVYAIIRLFVDVIYKANMKKSFFVGRYH